MIAVQIILMLLILYVVLILAPSFVMYYVVFRRKDRPHLWESDLSQTYYAPFADRMIRDFDFIQSLPLERISLKSADGLNLYGEYRSGGFSRTVLFYHGFGGTPYHQFSPQAVRLYQSGFNLLFPVQRAHNESSGKYTTLGITEAEDLLLWIEWAKNQPGCKEILLYGISMGCSAIEYASDRLDPDTVRGMILDCGFTSPYDQLYNDGKKHHVPGKVFLPYIVFFAKRFLSADIRKKTSDTLRETYIPALFVHGTEDRTVSVEQGIQNYEACSSEKDIVLVEGADHTLSFLCGEDDVFSGISQFIKKNFKTGSEQ